MDLSRELVLIVAHNLAIIKTIAGDALKPLGYQVEIIHNAANGLEAIARISPDLIITDLNLQDLSGKDLLVAIKSKYVDLPVIIIARDTNEGDILRAFRLGATDFICWPSTPAETVATVDRALKQSRTQRELDMLADKYKQANDEFSKRSYEFNTLLAVCKAIVTIDDQQELLSRIIAAAIQTTSADYGWLLVKKDLPNQFFLYETKNLPRPLMGLRNKIWEDELWSFVCQSSEMIAIHGKPLEKYDLAKYGKSALLAPIRMKDKVIGILTLMRKSEKPFVEYDQSLLQAITALASVSIANIYFNPTGEYRNILSKHPAPKQSGTGDQESKDFEPELEQSLDAAIDAILTLIVEEKNRLTPKQAELLATAQKELQKVLTMLEGSAP